MMPSLPRIILLWALLQAAAPVWSTAAGFTLLPLGVAGGLEEGNLSAYLVKPPGATQQVLLDGGTIREGLTKAFQNGALTAAASWGSSPVQPFIQQHIAAYFISHAHLDHVAGLAINATDDTAKPIFGLAAVLADVRDHLFNWRIWPNFGDDGPPPRLGKYHYQPLTAGKALTLPRINLTVEAWPLGHGQNYGSTAFLLESGGRYLLYCGDTGPDSVEGHDHLQRLWQRLAPLVLEQRLDAILLESAYPSDRPDALLFGHLTPRHLLAEMAVLATLVDSREAMKNLVVVVTHVKPAPPADLATSQERIFQELTDANPLAIQFRMAQQGVPMQF